MAATDLVPCFYSGQNYYADPPAEHRLRSEVRECKRQKLGEFRENGKIFLFFKAIAAKLNRLWDGPLGVGNAMPFSRRTDAGQHYHYEIPHAGDIGLWRHLRKRIRVSARSRHSQQSIAEAIRPLAPALAGSI
jgi:hypothetical protein